MVHWSVDGWKTAHDTRTRANGYGFHLADLPVDTASPGTVIAFTLYWPESEHWENADFSVTVEHEGG